MPILHPWTDERSEDRAETDDLIQRLTDIDWVISKNITGDEEGYWKFLCQWWNLTEEMDFGLLVIEHDNVPTYAQIAELQDCPEPVCCIPYVLKTGSWSIGWIDEKNWAVKFPSVILDDYSGHGLMRDKSSSVNEPIDPFFYRNDPKHLDPPINFSGFGFVKFGSIRQQINICDYPGYSKASDQPVLKHWSYIDWWFASQLKKLGLGWHVHNGQVKHNHREW